MSNTRRANGAAAPRVLIALTVAAGPPGADGVVQLHTEYDRATTARLLRQIADRFEAAGQPMPGEDTAP
jgi:hypothetical protein